MKKLEGEQMNKDRLLFLSNDVSEDSVKSLIEKILLWNLEDDERDSKEKDFNREPISIVINSYGGSIYDGLGLISVIEASKTAIHTYVFGKAMSMAFIVAASGHRRYASRLSTFMYHEGSGGVWGNFNHMENQVEENKRLQDLSDRIILEKTNIHYNTLLDVRKKQKDWYISAQEALELGVIDAII